MSFFGRNRTVLRSVLFFIVLGTLPFYILLMAAWALAPDPSAVPETIATENPNATFTPLGGDITVTVTATMTPTSNATSTPLSNLDPTPWQYIPPSFPTYTPSSSRRIRLRLP